MADLEAHKAQSEKQSPPDLPAADASDTIITTRQRRWAALKNNAPTWLVAGTAFINALFEILQALTVPIPDVSGVSGLLPLALYYWRHSLGLVFGLALLYLSLNLFRRKQVAWWLAVASSAAVALIRVGYGRAWYMVVVPVVTLGLLLLFRRIFTVRSEPKSIARGLGIVALSLIVALAYGTAGFWLLDERDFGIDFHLADAFAGTLREYGLLGND